MKIKALVLAFLLAFSVSSNSFAQTGGDTQGGGTGDTQGGGTAGDTQGGGEGDTQGGGEGDTQGGGDNSSALISTGDLTYAVVVVLNAVL